MNGEWKMNAVEIRERRRKLGLTQSELGVKIGVASNTISRWELGDVVPEHPKLIDLAFKALEYEAGYPVKVESPEESFEHSMKLLTELKERQEARASKLINK
jgi:transcriptional regulator with XRE-family HTH domain